MVKIGDNAGTPNMAEKELSDVPIRVLIVKQPKTIVLDNTNWGLHLFIRPTGIDITSIS